jgi:hypothetical protein
MALKLLEIGLYFDERIDLIAQEKMSLHEVANKLVVYPLHYFRDRYNLTLDYAVIKPHTLAYNTRGLLVLYNHLVADPQIAYLQELKVKGYIKSWAVFPPGTWKSYFDQLKEKSRSDDRL